MKRTPSTIVITAVAIAALAVTVPTTAVADGGPPAGSRRAPVAAEYVVAFAGSAAEAKQTVQAAGGAVVSIDSAVKAVKVSSTEPGFLNDVRRRSGIVGAARNSSVGTSTPGMPHRYAEERPAVEPGAAPAATRRHQPAGAEPLADLQWGSTMIGADAAHRKATGRGVDVGIMDTGIDASHPDLRANVDLARSRNFTTDIPALDGPCEVTSCVDPVGADDNGHGTHVAGIIAAGRNRLGIEGVAPDATLVELRAGQDSGYFFLYETVAALVQAGRERLDVVNMSFYADPWLYNCPSKADYLSGTVTVTDEEIAQQALARRLILRAVAYAHHRGVTLVGAAGNDLTNLALPTRTDASSPDYPADSAQPRVVTNRCLDLPNEAPAVIEVSSVGPSGTKADYSNYGLGSIDVAAPGGWYRDGIGTGTYQTPGNLVLSSYPLSVAVAEGLANPDGTPADDFSVRSCNAQGVCGFYTYLQGTSMASPYAAGVAALIVDRYGHRTRHHGLSLAPNRVRRILERSAADHACPAGGTEIYTDEGRPAEYNAVCQGSTDDNGLYGEGIVNAARAVHARPSVSSVGAR